MPDMTPDQIQSLLQQGAITPAQADVLAQNALVSAPPANMSGGPSTPPGSPPPGPPPAPNQSLQPNYSAPPAEPNQSVAPPMSQANQPTGLPPGVHPGPGGELVNADGIPVNSGITQVPPAAQLKPAPAPTDTLKGANTLTGQPPSPVPQGRGNGPQGINDPAQIYMPHAASGGVNLSPEKKLLTTTLGLTKEQVEALESQKTEQLKINEAQDVANQAVADMSKANTDAIRKEQLENQTSWKAAMEKANAQSEEIAKRARALGEQKINPRRYWDEMGPGAEFTARMFIGLAAMGAALTHSPNTAMEMTQKAIDADIAAQKGDIENAYRSLGIQQDEAHNALQRAQIQAAYNDKQAMVHWELLKTQALAIGQKAQSPIDKQKADMMAYGIDDKIRESKLSMAQNIYNFEALQRRASASSAGASESEVRKYITDRKSEFMQKGDNEQDANDRAVKLASERFGLKMTGGQATLPTLENQDSKSKRDALMITLPSGMKVEARNETAASEFSKKQTATVQLDRIIKRMQQIRDKHKGGTFNGADTAEARSLQEQAINAYNELTGFNRAPGTPEREGLKEHVIPDASAFSPRGSEDRKLQAFRQYVDQAYKANNITYLKDPTVAPSLDQAGDNEDVAKKIGAEAK